MLILITNDDGINSEGLLSLGQSLQSLGKIWTVAPERAQNAVGRALTLHRPLRIVRVSENRFTVNGTPSDCINLAVNSILPEKPVLVVSGINKGANLCDDISYSGTAAAAFEATILGIPAFAISMPGKNNFDFGPAARFATKVAKTIIHHGLPSNTFLNINVPVTNGQEITCWEITHQGQSLYDNTIIEKTDPRGEKYYWIGGDGTKHRDLPGSDANSVAGNHASLTPVTTDVTNYAAIDTLKKWKF